MTIIVTCGPSYEPIDEVRRITNFSTGELGILLANRLVRDGHKVICLKGAGATYPGRVLAEEVETFTTNDSLLALLRSFSKKQRVGAVFHVAALSDFKVKRVDDGSGKRRTDSKIPSRIDSLTIHLEPALKVISRLRRMFPKAHLVGWKYELAGTRDEALAKGWRQLRENRTDMCVVNGRAFGPGFGCCAKPDRVDEFPSKFDLVDFLAKSLPKRRRTSRRA